MKWTNQKQLKTFSLSPLAFALIGMVVPHKGYADNYFNPAFLANDPAAVADLSRFEGNGQAPGTYRVEVWLNGVFLSSRDVVFNARGRKSAESERGG